MKTAQSRPDRYQRIGVALDNTAESEQALRWAIAVAQRARCPLDLVHVVAQAPASGVVTRRLPHLADEVGRYGVTANVSVLDGTAPTTLVDHFNATAADLIVLTRHDEGRLEHLLFGSVAESVTRRAHVPVLVVHSTDAEVSLEPSVEIREILLAVDGSAFAEQIVPHAVMLAHVMQSEITVIGVLQPVLAVASAGLDEGPAPTVPLSRAPNGIEHGALSTPELEQVASNLRQPGIAVRTVVLSDGQPARAIVEYAAQHGIDLIAMTTHGRGALKRAIVGSVSESVLRKSRLPMLLFRPQM